MKYYLCGIAFQHELNSDDGPMVYTSIEALKEDHDPWSECGIVELESESEWKNYHCWKWLVRQNPDLHEYKPKKKSKDGN